MNASAGSVERKLADRNAHAVDTKVTQTEDARAVRDDGDFDIVRPILNHRVQVALVRERKIHPLWLSVQLAPALACLANGGCVDQRCELLHLCQYPIQPSQLLLQIPTLTLFANKR